MRKLLFPIIIARLATGGCDSSQEQPYLHAQADLVAKTKAVAESLMPKGKRNMSLWDKIGIIISFLLILDGLVCLIFIDKIEGWIKQAFPSLNLIPIAAIEILLGGILGLFILMWR